MHVSLVGNLSRYLLAEQGILVSGGIYHPSGGKQRFEDLIFKGTAFVAHIHPFVQ